MRSRSMDSFNWWF